MSPPTPSVSSFYNARAAAEHARLPAHPLEFRLTSILLASLLGPPSQRIADVGGGTGRYALSLARLGHRVYYSDISSALLEICRQTALSQGVLLECYVQADAARLRECPEIFRPGFFDMILLLGPLYHLSVAEQREKCLRDCAGMLKNGGVLVAAVINKVSHLRDMVQKDPGRLEREWAFYARYLKDGVYDRRDDGGVGWHTDPAETRRLIESVPGLIVEEMIAAEGVLGGLSDRLKDLDGKELDRWVQVNTELSRRTGAVEGADHVLIVARKVEEEVKNLGK